MTPSSTRVQRALFPGTFDPPTLGHLDLLRRALRLFGQVIVGVAHHPQKRNTFSAEERVALLRAATAELAGVTVVIVPGLVVDACLEHDCDVIVRGVRSGTDFDYELQMGRTNAELSGVETVLLVPAPERAHISSTLVRQIAALGGDVSSFVPPCVLEPLRERVAAPVTDPDQSPSR